MLTASEIIELDEDYFLKELVTWIDHRAKEEDIIRGVARLIQVPLSPLWKAHELWLDLDGEEYALPLTHTVKDRYVALGSLCALLKKRYTFWLVKDSLDGDSHGLFITSNPTAEALEVQHRKWLESRLVKMMSGYDYFSATAVPTLQQNN